MWNWQQQQQPQSRKSQPKSSAYCVFVVVVVVVIMMLVCSLQFVDIIIFLFIFFFIVFGTLMCSSDKDKRHHNVYLFAERKQLTSVHIYSTFLSVWQTQILYFQISFFFRFFRFSCGRMKAIVLCGSINEPNNLHIGQSMCVCGSEYWEISIQIVIVLAALRHRLNGGHMVFVVCTTAD